MTTRYGDGAPMTDPKTPTIRAGENLFIAEKLREVGDLLEQQNATQFRVNAYRDAANYVASLSEPIRTIYRTRGKRGGFAREISRWARRPRRSADAGVSGAGADPCDRVWQLVAGGAAERPAHHRGHTAPGPTLGLRVREA